jgi:ATP-dependent DNA ligase
MTVVEILELIEQTSGTNAKKDVLERHSGNALLRRVIRLALDPYIVFNVGRYKLGKKFAAPPHSDTNVAAFCAVLERLDKEQIRGKDAIRLLDHQFEHMTDLEAKWCQRVLLKKPRLGINESSISDVLPGLIRTFEVALCKTLDVVFETVKDVAFIRALKSNYAGERVVHISGNAYYLVIGEEVTLVTIKTRLDYKGHDGVGVQQKRDGERVIAFKRGGKVTLMSRNGNEIETLPHIVKLIEDAEVDNVVLDGEVMGADWNESASVIASTKNAKDTSNTNFYVFSAFPIGEWDTQEFLTPYSEQLSFAATICEAIGNAHVQVMPIKVVHSDLEMLEAYLDELDAGHEGVILKPIDGRYTLGKTDEGWWKFKPEQTYEGSIVGWFKGATGSKRENAWAGFWIMLDNGVATRVGIGWKDEDRAEYDLMVQTGTIEQMFGKILECKAQPPLTKDGKMRFPRAQRAGGALKWRSRKDVDPAVCAAYDRWASRCPSDRDQFAIERRKGDA